MPAKTSVQNNFTKGLKTEFSGLNFPEDACTATSNCTFHRIGNVTRRNGFDYETNFVLTAIDRTEKAISTFRWLDAGGDGETQLLVLQVGATLYFFKSSSATTASPLSAQLLTSTITLVASSAGSSIDTIECQYSQGNGYLFVYHPNMNPIYCTFFNGVVTSNIIDIKIRDFIGDVEVGVLDNLRPGTLTNTHNYNLQNQGWTQGFTWITTSNTGQVYEPSPPVNWTFYGTGTGLIAQAGDLVKLDAGGGQIQNKDGSFPAALSFIGLVTNYNSTAGVLNITITENVTPAWSDEIMIANNARWASEFTTFNIFSAPQNDKITFWRTAVGNYPSNADVWWQFKNTSNVFDPLTTVSNVTLNSGPAPKGFFILDAFNLDRSAVSNVPGINPVTTSERPKTGTWFQGRVWYTGVDASVSQQDITTPPSNPIFYSWSENIYFSQVITNASQFGKCHQTNDPTSEDLFDLLPTDGGVIQIQGAGSIIKLFPIQNGMLVFAANGIWFITGSSGVGFSANDYTITKISGVESLSATSFVDVQGLPMFWNEEDIYYVTPAAQDKRNNEQLGLSVSPITLTTIKAFYNNIPTISKRYARGAYNPITNQLQFIYRSTSETDITSRYEFDSILNFNTLTQAFYPWTISPGAIVNSITYVINPGGTAAPTSIFKYLTSELFSDLSYRFTFSEEKDNTNWVDWHSTPTPENYVSTFTTGYALHGDAIRKWGPEYVFVYSNEILTPIVIPTPPPPPPPPPPPHVFSTWNPLDKTSNVTLSNGNLTAAGIDASDGGVRSVLGHSTGKYYVEFSWLGIALGSLNTGVGITYLARDLSTIVSPWNGVYQAGVGGQWFFNGSNSGGSNMGPAGAGDLTCMALDLVNNRVWFRLNNVPWFANGTADPANNIGGVDISATFPSQGLAYLLYTTKNDLAGNTCNFGASPFKYTPPVGFTSWG